MGMESCLQLTYLHPIPIVIYYSHSGVLSNWECLKTDEVRLWQLTCTHTHSDHLSGEGSFPTSLGHPRESLGTQCGLVGDNAHGAAHSFSLLPKLFLNLEKHTSWEHCLLFMLGHTSGFPRTFFPHYLPLTPVIFTGGNIDAVFQQNPNEQWQNKSLTGSGRTISSWIWTLLPLTRERNAHWAWSAVTKEMSFPYCTSPCLWFWHAHTGIPRINQLIQYTGQDWMFCLPLLGSDVFDFPGQSPDLKKENHTPHTHMQHELITFDSQISDLNFQIQGVFAHEPWNEVVGELTPSIASSQSHHPLHLLSALSGESYVLLCGLFIL